VRALELRYSTRTLLLLTLLVAVVAAFVDRHNNLSPTVAALLAFWFLGGFVTGWSGRHVPCEGRWRVALALAGILLNVLATYFVDLALRFADDYSSQISGGLSSGFVGMMWLQSHYIFAIVGLSIVMAIAAAGVRQPEWLPILVLGSVGMWLVVFAWGFVNATVSLVDP
jgi:hypothetical protein